MTGTLGWIACAYPQYCLNPDSSKRLGCSMTRFLTEVGPIYEFSKLLISRGNHSIRSEIPSGVMFSRPKFLLVDVQRPSFGHWMDPVGGSNLLYSSVVNFSQYGPGTGVVVGAGVGGGVGVDVGACMITDPPVWVWTSAVAVGAGSGNGVGVAGLGVAVGRAVCPCCGCVPLDCPGESVDPTWVGELAAVAASVGRGVMVAAVSRELSEAVEPAPGDWVAGEDCEASGSLPQPKVVTVRAMTAMAMISTILREFIPTLGQGSLSSSIESGRG